MGVESISNALLWKDKGRNATVRECVFDGRKHPCWRAGFCLGERSLIVEILSPSTKAFDQSDKFTYYKSIESFTEYLLITQTRPHVVLYTKQSETTWLHREYNSLDETVFLSSLDCEISLAEIYLGIEFPEIEHPRFPFEREDFR